MKRTSTKPRHSEQIFLSLFAPRYIEVPLESKKAWKRTLPMISSLKHNTRRTHIETFPGQFTTTTDS